MTAAYGEMLPRQPLRFLLADDPGAGNTIMAGLFVKELAIRGDLERCLVIAPGGLVEQWQDELHEKFGLPFDILTRDQLEAARTGNPFAEKNLLIARLDVLSRNADVQARLTAAKAWDLVICDEAHRMSASFFGGEVKYTKRYQLGQVVAGHCRHFMLMTATPHNGKEEDFQLFMALLDLKAQERAGKKTRLSSANTEARANDLSDRLQRRLADLTRERDISALPPVIRGGAIVVPAGQLPKPAEQQPAVKQFAEDTAAVEQAAMNAVMEAERRLGFAPRNVSGDRLGYDIESRDGNGALRFIEVKGRVAGADTVTVTRNEILTALNKPDDFILAIVPVQEGFAHEPRYVRRPFTREPDFGATSVIYRLPDLFERSETPC